ncbi:hypothetical protein CDAR_38281 [Caerostris darwini]|uniref:Secreted protein n=1 Tax=Caerostris darwini TaxID=1538125 RepID=A0AAV4V3A4_9ARAC|nr:hypothetical protein CDAR_38281 [Caerostris darwini]
MKKVGPRVFATVAGLYLSTQDVTGGPRMLLARRCPILSCHWLIGAEAHMTSYSPCFFPPPPLAQTSFSSQNVASSRIICAKNVVLY